MLRAKLALIYTALGVFVAFSIIGICGAIGWLKISDIPTASAIFGPCLGIVAAALNAKHVFDDPESVTKLRQEHHDAIASLKAEQTEMIMTLNQRHSEVVATLKQSHLDEVLRLDQVKAIEIADLTAKHTKEKKELKDKISELKYPGMNPLAFMPPTKPKTALIPTRPPFHQSKPNKP